MKLRYAPQARTDIAGIHAYIAKYNSRAAKAVISGIQTTALLLAEYPGLGRVTDIAEIRVLPVARYPYLVYHLVNDDEVIIVHIRHGAR